jgi:vacuolar-type H+-ATPase subunit H
VSTDGPARRREIEDSTAARLAEIVAAAERAAKRVIDEAEEEARTRLADAHEEADRIVAARLGGLADLTDEIGAQAEALVRQAEALQQALARAKAEMGAPEAPGGSVPTGHREADPTAHKPAGPALTVVGGAPEEAAPEARIAAAETAAPREAPATIDTGQAPEPEPDFDPSPRRGAGTPAGARLLATQMAVSGSSRAEIEARLRDGFAIADTRAILDAILGPEQ